MDVLTWSRIETVQRLWGCWKCGRGDFKESLNSAEALADAFPQVDFADSFLVLASGAAALRFQYLFNANKATSSTRWILNDQKCFSLQSSKPEKSWIEIVLILKKFQIPPLAHSLSIIFQFAAVQIIVMARVVSSKLINGFFRLNISMNYWFSFPFLFHLIIPRFDQTYLKSQRED